jgi:hypothetical protein
MAEIHCFYSTTPLNESTCHLDRLALKRKTLEHGVICRANGKESKKETMVCELIVQ